MQQRSVKGPILSNQTKPPQFIPEITIQTKMLFYIYWGNPSRNSQIYSSWKMSTRVTSVKRHVVLAKMQNLGFQFLACARGCAGLFFLANTHSSIEAQSQYLLWCLGDGLWLSTIVLQNYRLRGLSNTIQL